MRLADRTCQRKNLSERDRFFLFAQQSWKGPADRQECGRASIASPTGESRVEKPKNKREAADVTMPAAFVRLRHIACRRDDTSRRNNVFYGWTDGIIGLRIKSA